MRYFAILTISLVCAFGVAANGQEKTKQETKIKGDAAQTMTYAGCVATGAQTTTYLLNNSIPVTKTVEQQKGTGTVTTTTSYVLVPGSDKITFTNLVGHKVEVTGVMIPAGKDTKVESKTKIEREGAPDVKIQERKKTDGAAMPQFRVLSVKELPDPCTP
jgi:hypothetical protein